MSERRRLRRAAQQSKRLHMLADRFYNDTVARKDKQGILRPVGTVQEVHIVSAYVGGSQYHRERIEEFKPVFTVVSLDAPLREQIHNFS